MRASYQAIQPFLGGEVLIGDGDVVRQTFSTLSNAQRSVLGCDEPECGYIERDGALETQRGMIRDAWFDCLPL